MGKSKQQLQEEAKQATTGIPATRINATPIKGSNQEAAEKAAKTKK